MKKFNPIECGFSKRLDKDGEEEFVLIIENKVIGRIFYLHMVNTWYAYHVVHTVQNGWKEDVVFKGKIPDNKFAKELFKNIFSE